jgi:hypothetical protein
LKIAFGIALGTNDKNTLITPGVSRFSGGNYGSKKYKSCF